MGYMVLALCTLFLPPKPGEVTTHLVVSTGDRDITMGHLGTGQKSNALPRHMRVARFRVTL